uniref:Reverse transcriptase domain-containing protein n=1 Tax=Tanacetum cinerariifolium TaxID=118510 RepID=A0A699HBP2_TANCI|nr:hypothetical protein [Tanacetum cinerariifolium]
MNPSYFEPNPCYDSKYSSFDKFQPPHYFDVQQPPKEISIDELRIMMQSYYERINQQREQEALLATQREKELHKQEQAAQEKENSDFRRLIGEMCGTKFFEEQKQNMEDRMLEIPEDCRQKELYCMHNDVEDLIESALNSKLLSINLKSQRLDKEKQKVKNIIEQPPKHRTRLTKCLENFKVIHNERTISLNNTSQISLINAIAPVLPTEELDNSLSMGDEHLSTIPKTELDKVIKSSVENLVPILSESEVNSDNESECDVPVNDESSPIFTTFSNPLFDCNNDFTSSDEKSLSNEDVPMIYSNSLFDDGEIISIKIDPHYFNAESNLIESLLNRDTLIDSSPKFDYFLEEFSGELAHIDPIPQGIEEADFDLEKEIRLVKNLLHDNSSPRPPEERT